MRGTSLLPLIMLTLCVAQPPAAQVWEHLSPDWDYSTTRIGLYPGDPEQIFVGTWGYGLMRSYSGVFNWERNWIDFFNDGGAAATIVHEVSFDPANPLHAVAITAAGSFASSTWGHLWYRHPANDQGYGPGFGFRLLELPDGSGALASEVALGPTNPGQSLWLYDWSTLDWTDLYPDAYDLIGNSTVGMDFGIGNPPVLYACFTALGILASSDLLASYEIIAEGLPDVVGRAVLADPELPGRAMVGVNGGVFLRRGGEDGFEPWGLGIPGGSIITSLLHHPEDPDIVYAGGSMGPYVSEDRGEHFAPMSTAGMLHTVVTDFAIHPEAPQFLLAACSDGSSEHGGVYRLEIGSSTGLAQAPATPSLEQNRPNPFNPRTRIGFSLARSERASLRIYDTRGRLVRILVDETLDAGDHVYEWDGRDDRGGPAASGLFLYRLETREGPAIARRMLLLK